MDGWMEGECERKRGRNSERQRVGWREIGKEGERKRQWDGWRGWEGRERDGDEKRGRERLYLKYSYITLHNTHPNF